MTATDAPDPGPRPGSSQARLVALALIGPLFLQALNGTAMATAAPALARAFGCAPSRIALAMTSYLLVMVVLVPASGWLADRHGVRRILQAGIMLFTLGAAVCGLAADVAMLVAGSVIQAVGASLMVPQTRLALLRNVPQADYVAATAWVATPSMMARVAGPVVGGMFATHLNVSALFFLNIPIGIIALLLVRWRIQEAAAPPAGSFDPRGMMLAGLTSAGLVAGFDFTAHGVLAPLVGAALIAAGLGAAVAYWRHASVHPSPFLDLSLLRHPGFGRVCAVMTVFRFGMGAVPFLVPMLMQAGLGFTPAESGMITFVGSLGGMMARPVAASVFRVLGYRATMVWGTVLAGGFVALCATFRAEWPIAAFCVVLLTAGVLRSIQTTAFSTLAFAEVPSDRYRPANSLFVACQPLATVFGMAAGVAFLDLVAATAGREVPEPADFGWTFLVLGGVILLGAPVAMRLPRTAGDTLVHRTAVEG